MKTRILYPKNIWFDKRFKGLTTTSKLLSIYLVSNANIGLSRIYQQHDLEIGFLFSLSENELNRAKEELTNAGLFVFKEEWVYINNDFAYVDYEGRDRLLEAREKELNSIPLEISNYFKEVINGLTTGYKPPINHKSKTINNKTETIIHKTEIDEILGFFNTAFGKRYTSSASWEENFKVWRKRYELQEISDAITSWASNGWLWKIDGEPDLALLFRTSNKAGKCDYIGQLLNRQTTRPRALKANQYLTANGVVKEMGNE